MTPFPPEHEPRLRAVDGRFGLGDWESANAELDELPAFLGAHPRALALRVRVFAAAGRWDIADEIGRKVAQTAAVDAEMLLALAQCAVGLGKPHEARQWLALAFELDDSDALQRRVMADRRLAAAWSQDA